MTSLANANLPSIGLRGGSYVDRDHAGDGRLDDNGGRTGVLDASLPCHPACRSVVQEEQRAAFFREYECFGLTAVERSHDLSHQLRVPR
jgi:hypothetical protein